MTGATPAAARKDPNISQVIADTIRMEMERDPRIVFLGEDVGYSGGTFGASRGLHRRFGDWRVRDTPISEIGFTGLAVGLAMSGWRPLVEIMFVDFIGVCLEQIYNAIAKNRYMSGGRVRMPVTIRTAGGCIGVAAQHSQCLWGTLAHLPGLQVVVPSNPYDFRGLLAAALESEDPTIIIEHKDLYLRRSSSFRIGAELPPHRFLVEIGRAAVVREGSDVTIATLSTMVERSLHVADRLAAERIEVEVVDLRSVSPLDHATIARSVAKTSRLLVVDEDYQSFGLSGELITRVVEALGPSGIRAAGRVANPDVPVPAALVLEREIIPGEDRIERAVRSLLDERPREA
jgi:pyruvate/2-oxoglutarate/acetoin dehydrogenase E1 component